MPRTRTKRAAPAKTPLATRPTFDQPDPGSVVSSAWQRREAADPPPPGTTGEHPSLPLSPSERAWAAVVTECPQHRDDASHRSGAFVHVVPLGEPEAVQCVEAEESRDYPRFYRPRGGYPKEPTMRLTFTYQAAEMTGRA